MGKWRMNACPKCRGSMYMEKDLIEGLREKCISCGYTISLVDNRTGKDKEISREIEKMFFKEAKV